MSVISFLSQIFLREQYDNGPVTVERWNGSQWLHFGMCVDNDVAVRTMMDQCDKMFPGSGIRAVKNNRVVDRI